LKRFAKVPKPTGLLFSSASNNSDMGSHNIQRGTDIAWYTTGYLCHVLLTKLQNLQVSLLLCEADGDIPVHKEITLSMSYTEFFKWIHRNSVGGSKVLYYWLFLAWWVWESTNTHALFSFYLFLIKRCERSHLISNTETGLNIYRTDTFIYAVRFFH
jgi:hypothetical protein